MLPASLTPHSVIRATRATSIFLSVRAIQAKAKPRCGHQTSLDLLRLPIHECLQMLPPSTAKGEEVAREQCLQLREIWGGMMDSMLASKMAGMRHKRKCKARRRQRRILLLAWELRQGIERVEWGHEKRTRQSGRHVRRYKGPCVA